MDTWSPGSLDSDQEGVLSDSGNVFLVACPGSGKTRTLTYKVASELSQLGPDHRQFVAAITYTHRAADEIEERIASLGVDTDKLWIGTIHSFCLEWILKPYGVYHPKLHSGFQIINAYETEAMLERLCVGSNPKITTYDCGYHFDENGVQLESGKAWLHPEIRRILSRYFGELEFFRQVDFAHLLHYSYELIRDRPEISQILGKLFSFIAIDEYQDTTKIQYLMLGAILKASNGTARTLIVGDPNQAIFTSLGGIPIQPNHFRNLIGGQLTERQLVKNYRSSARVVDYFSHFNVHQTRTESASRDKNHPSLITFNEILHHEGLEAELVRLVRYNIEILGVDPHEVCILAPWWTHLASVTRNLVTALPEYEFDGPGLVPFSRDRDNFWYKLARIGLTEASPTMYMRRLRWAQDVISDLLAAGADVSRVSSRSLLLESNGIEVHETNGLEYLREYFRRLLGLLDISMGDHPSLSQQHDAFFASSSARIERMVNDGAPFMTDITVFRRVFRERTGITVSSIHGVKGAEFDTVIAYALLDGMVPHFNDKDQENGAKKLLYVIASRARKNLHLIAERGRPRGRRGEYDSTSVPLGELAYEYDSSAFWGALGNGEGALSTVPIFVPAG
ncbi:UvrD-helicase domain-containing protein [Cryobacterium sp. TMB1-7]|uniref:UvrD-helicase domain-containing protein n=1 Tax=Cryobacterium sp. TMB1-7 TaxID=2555866 RepID=UPI00106CBBA9|nr:ATP-dependent helicase [Cryobacterium sp. TMB1-7]TFC63102.1 ATP-dependent helicase [Cryobacterium sp. TMB1-7]